MSDVGSDAKGSLGEFGTALLHSMLRSQGYHIFNDLMIETSSRYTQIDHVLVSNYGIFVVETKHMSGWIFGAKENKYWTQVLFPSRSKTRFENPLRQNYLHTKSISEFCSVGDDKIHSVIVFWGDCRLKTRMPANVRMWHEYYQYISSRKEVILADDEVNRICSVLDAVKRHRRAVGTIKCPSCGGKLIKRTAKKGKETGKEFLVCQNYPRCPYLRSIDR